VVYRPDYVNYIEYGYMKSKSGTGCCYVLHKTVWYINRERKII